MTPELQSVLDRLEQVERGNRRLLVGKLELVCIFECCARELPLPNPDQSGLRSEGWGEGEQDSAKPSAPNRASNRPAL